MKSRCTRPPQTRFVGMMQYDGDLKLPTNYLVPPPEILHVSGEMLILQHTCRLGCRVGAGWETICAGTVQDQGARAAALPRLMARDMHRAHALLAVRQGCCLRCARHCPHSS
jgi:hypothetical protein